jgi:hypothetical protein
MHSSGWAHNHSAQLQCYKDTDVLFHLQLLLLHSRCVPNSQTWTIPGLISALYIGCPHHGIHLPGHPGNCGRLLLAYLEDW